MEKEIRTNLMVVTTVPSMTGDDYMVINIVVFTSTVVINIWMLMVLDNISSQLYFNVIV